MAADIVFVVDSSGSIRYNQAQGTEDNWKVILNFIANFIKRSSRTRVRYGLVKYSTEVVNEFFLNTYNSTDQHSATRAHVLNMTYMGNDTATAAALRLARTQQFVEANGDRDKIKNILIVITDGYSKIQPLQTIPEANRLHEDNVIVFAVGITSNVKEAEIRGMSSPPHTENRTYFLQPDFESLAAFVDQLSQITCDVQKEHGKLVSN